MSRGAGAFVAVTCALGADVFAAPAPRVFTDVGEGRACLPHDGGALIGTGGGLAKLDARGAVTSVWTATDGLPGTRIETIVELGGELWIGTDAGAAVIALDGDRMKVARTLGKRGVRDVLQHGGATYLATWGAGVQKVTARDPLDVPFRVASKNAHRPNVTSLAVANGTLYAGTAAGLYRLADGKLDAVAFDGLPVGTPINALHAMRDQLWIATAEALHVRTGDNTRAYPATDVRRIGERDGSIIVASLGDGLAMLDRGRLVPLAGAPKELAIAQTVGTRGRAMCAGGLDGTWLHAGGDSTWLRALPRSGPPSNDISALAADGDRLWVGTFDRGLALRERGEWRTIQHAAMDHRINALHVEHVPKSGTRLWIGTANGLVRDDGKNVVRLTRTEGIPSRSVLAITGLRDGRVLVGTSAGAAIVDGMRATRIASKTAELGNVWAVAETADGSLWLGTTTGVYRGREGDDAWQRYSLATHQLRDDWVMSLVARDNTVWVGTYKGGVTRFDVANTAVTVTQLGDGWINPNGLALDGDRLLASTMDGLLAGDGKSAAWSPPTTRLPGKDVTATARVGASHYVATRRGLAELR